MAGSHKEQTYQATKFYHALLLPGPTKFFLLRDSTYPNPVIINVPNSNRFRVFLNPTPIFNDQFASIQAGSLPNSFKTIAGSIPSLSNPTPTKIITFPDSMFSQVKLPIPTAATIRTRTNNDPDLTVDSPWPLLRMSKIKKEDKCDENVLIAAPVPLFIVRDHLDKDIHGLELLNRLNHYAQDCTVDASDDMWANLQNLVFAGMSQYHGNAKRPFFTDQEFWYQAPNEDDFKWAQGKLRNLYRDKLSNIPLPPTPPSTVQGFTPANVMEMFNKFLEATASSTSKKKGRQVSTDDDESEEEDNEGPTDPWVKKLGISRLAIDKYLHLCQLPSGEEENLPDWIAKLNAKKLSQSDKEALIVDTIQKFRLWTDDDTHVHPYMVKCISKHNWMGISSTRLTESNCMMGVNLFLFREYSEEEKTEQRNNAVALEKASTTTIKDHIPKFGSPVVPPTARDLMDQIKQFANVYHALSGGGCVISQCCTDIISILRSDWSKDDRSKLTRNHLGTIMWTIATQTRYFLGDSRAKTKPIHPMMTQLIHRLHALEFPPANGSTPTCLTSFACMGPDNNKRVSDFADINQRPTKTPRNQQQREQRTEPIICKINPIISTALGKSLARAKTLGFRIRTICRRCGAPKPHQLFPEDNKCAVGALFGTCHINGCTRKHNETSDEDAQVVVKHLAKLKDAPDEVLQGQ